MPKIGLSQMWCAKRNYDEVSQQATYSGGMLFGRAVQYSTDITSTDNNNFHADNVVAESVNGEFSSGTLNTTTAELTSAVSMFILGLETSTVTVGEKTVTVYDYGSGASPELGWGVVEKGRVKGEDTWDAVFLPRISFNVPSTDVSTQGEEIEWQTQEASATIMREQQGKQLWQRRASFDTEAEAVAFIKQLLNITDETPEG